MLPISFKKRGLEIHSARHEYDVLDGNLSAQENPKHCVAPLDPKAPSRSAARRSPLFGCLDKMDTEDPTRPHVPRTTE